MPEPLDACIWPETHGSPILDLRYRSNEGGDFVPALVEVDANGKEINRVVEVRNGGGHVELTRALMFNSLFSVNSEGKVMLHPEGV